MPAHIIIHYSETYKNKGKVYERKIPLAELPLGKSVFIVTPKNRETENFIDDIYEYGHRKKCRFVAQMTIKDKIKGATVWRLS